jgi:hypothetical protein
MSNYNEMSDQELWDLTSDDDDSIKADAYYSLGQRFLDRKRYSDAIGPLTAAKDLYKNCALAWMRLHAVSKLLPQLNDRLTALSQDKKITVRCSIFYLSSSFVSSDHLF